MDPGHPNAVLLRHAYSHAMRGDALPLAALLHGDAVYHLPGRHLGGGDLTGHQAILSAMAAAAASCDAPPRVDVLAVVASDAFGVTLEHTVMERHARTLDQIICAVWRIEAGRCVEIWAHFSDQRACDAFWQD